MDLLEYQGKEVFSKMGLAIPRGKTAFSVGEVEKIVKEIGGPVVIKVQIPSGGRGKAGGVKFAGTPEEAVNKAEKLFDMDIKGFKPEALLIEQKLQIKNEIYAGITVDRNMKRPIFMVSSEGGMEIEEVAEKAPEKIFSRHVDPLIGFYPYMAREFAAKLELEGEEFKSVSSILFKLYRIFEKYDALIAEINPLVIAEEGVFAADSKLALEDDALFRNPEFKKKDSGDLPYVELDGNIGCIVNGAGLAMATMDTIKHLGGSPANFLDTGGGASSEVMKRALKKVASHPGVKVIFINILGGITRCDEIARGILGAIEGIKIPIVVRFRGTNEEEGVEILKNAGFEVDRDVIKASKKGIEMAGDN